MRRRGRSRAKDDEIDEADDVIDLRERLEPYGTNATRSDWHEQLEKAAVRRFRPRRAKPPGQAGRRPTT